MLVSIFLPVFAAVVLAQDGSSSTIDYATQTNSLGVVTGQPPPATSQPLPATSIPSLPSAQTSLPTGATLPALGNGVFTIPRQGTAGVNSTETLIVSVSGNSTVLSTLGVAPSSSSVSPTKTGPKATGSGVDENGDPTSTGSETANSTGAAATMRAVAGGFVGVGAFVAAFL